MPQQLLFLELNEINFESIAFYGDRLPTFHSLVQAHGWQTTTSEQKYEHLEPWIQWVTAHTGLSFAEHQVMRLGDIVNREIPQIWERLEECGLVVGAVSPMNAKHRVRQPAFFVPDPWTSTEVTAPAVLRMLYQAIAQVVNDNAQSRVTPASLFRLLCGLLRYARPANYARYLELIAGSARHGWRKAMVLDLLLADTFVHEVRRTQPNFATLFMNSGAHIQHHYMFSSASYTGPLRNPTWYAPPGVDPLFEVYSIYDRIVGQVRSAFPGARLMIATGLHQVPHGDVTYYWRLKNHAAFLRRIGVDCVSVEPRMSRDFLITCRDAAAAAAAAGRLTQAVADDGLPLFEVDNRGADLFVMLTYPQEITPALCFSIGETRFTDLYSDVAFVALKNGEHSGIGYFLDTGAVREAVIEFPLAQIPQRIMAALGVNFPTPSHSSVSI